MNWIRFFVLFVASCCKKRKLLDRKSGLAEAVTPEIASKDDR
jgi:hypothetical protein